MGAGHRPTSPASDDSAHEQAHRVGPGPPELNTCQGMQHYGRRAAATVARPATALTAVVQRKTPSALKGAARCRAVVGQGPRYTLRAPLRAQAGSRPTGIRMGWVLTRRKAHRVGLDPPGRAGGGLDPPESAARVLQAPGVCGAIPQASRALHSPARHKANGLPVGGRPANGAKGRAPAGQDPPYAGLGPYSSPARTRPRGHRAGRDPNPGAQQGLSPTRTGSSRPDARCPRSRAYPVCRRRWCR